MTEATEIWFEEFKFNAEPFVCPGVCCPGESLFNQSPHNPSELRK